MRQYEFGLHVFQESYGTYFKHPFYVQTKADAMQHDASDGARF